MDRRSALKWMGFSLAAAAMAGVAPLTHAAIVKDRKHGKKRLVFYFTATGNSLFVARQFSDTPLSIPQELKNNDLTHEADEIAFVCPDYAGAIPKIVREFVSKGTGHHPRGGRCTQGLHRSCQLRNRSLSFVDISEMFNFSSPVYFSRYVQRYLGESPSEYRR